MHHALFEEELAVKKIKPIKTKTAKGLGILPKELKALKAFVTAPALGRTVSVNGHAHYYKQNKIEIEYLAEENECGTAGCVAGFVFAHAKHVQGVRRLRGSRSATGYYNQAMDTVILRDLYGQTGGTHKLATARKVVTKMLATGKVHWPRAPIAYRDDD